MSRYEKVLLVLISFLCGILGLCVAIACTAEAEPITVRVVAVRGENMLPAAQTKRIMQQALRYYDNACWINIKLKRFEVRKNPMPWIGNGLSDTKTILYAWESWFKGQRSKVDIKFAVLPPLKDSAQYWIAGYSTDSCDRGGTGYSTAEPKNQQGYARVVHSATAMRHELGHLLGATDRSGSGLMDTGVLYQIGAGIPELDAHSQWEIVRCAGRW